MKPPPAFRSGSSATLLASLLLLGLPSSQPLQSAEKPATPAAGGKASDKPDTPPVPTVIESGSLKMSSTDKDQIAIFDKNVVVTGTNLKITCDHLEVVASRIGDPKAAVGKLDKFKSMVATGRVHIIQGDREVTCERAEVYPREERIDLKGNPVVIDHSGPYTASGREITLIRGERQLFGEDIKFVGPAIDDLGFDKKKEMKAPAKLPEKKDPAPPPQN